MPGRALAGTSKHVDKPALVNDKRLDEMATAAYPQEVDMADHVSEETSTVHTEGEEGMILVESKRGKRRRTKKQQENEGGSDSDLSELGSDDDTSTQGKRLRGHDLTEDSSASRNSAWQAPQRSDGNEGNVPGRRRLYFPNECQLTITEKRMWAARLARARRSYEPTLKEGQNRAYITVDGEAAVQELTTTGYDGTVMELPEERGTFTKVLVGPYEVGLDPELLLEDERVVWAKRRVVRGEDRNSVIALVRGGVPDKLRVLGNGYRKARKYIDEPVLCYNCNRWGHKAWRCVSQTRCGYCGQKHESKVCRDKIIAQERVKPKCCNCGQEHNAWFRFCVKRPQIRQIPHSEGRRAYVDASPPPVNAWGPGSETRGREGGLVGNRSGGDGDGGDRVGEGGPGREGRARSLKPNSDRDLHQIEPVTPPPDLHSLMLEVKRVMVSVCDTLQKVLKAQNQQSDVIEKVSTERVAENTSVTEYRMESKAASVKSVTNRETGVCVGLGVVEGISGDAVSGFSSGSGLTEDEGHARANVIMCSELFKSLQEMLSSVVTLNQKLTKEEWSKNLDRIWDNTVKNLKQTK